MGAEVIVAAGAGRMGRGIAVTFAMAGHAVRLLDLKRRDAGADAVLREALAEIEATLTMLSILGVLPAEQVATVARRVTCHGLPEADAVLADAGIVFEGVPETLDAKSEALAHIGRAAPGDAIIASTTSTILSDALQGLLSGPRRFLNAHWLNPAFLVPLVELSPGRLTDPEITARLKSLLEGIGKVPVVCAASPGYIVPRIQALAMNEAARLVEEGVATAEDIDKATRYGFGFRFAVLGLLEFIDWGGGDILYHASRYMTDATGEARFEAPEIIQRNMEESRNGLRDGAGFMDYDGLDVPAYRQQRLAAFVAMLNHLGKPPFVA